MSRAKDLHDLLQSMKDFQAGGNDIKAMNALYNFSRLIGLGNRVGEFVGIYYKMVDAAIDEVMEWKGFSVERRNKLVEKIQKSRDLIVYASAGSWKEFKDQFATAGYLDILELIDDALVSGGKVDNFIADKKDEYLAELEIIYAGISESDLHVKIKMPVLGHLDSLIQIFRRIDVTGAMNADSHLKNILAELVIHGDEIASSSEAAQKSLYPLMDFLKKYYPDIKWSADLLMTAANAGLLAVQSGAL